MADKDDWEERLLEQLLGMLNNLGINLDRDDLERMMDHFRQHMEGMGIDLEKAGGDVRFNFDMDDLAKVFNGGGGLDELLRGLGLDVTVDAKQVEVDESAQPSSPDVELPPSDVFLEDWNMIITLDVARRADLTSDQVELTLVEEGQQIEVMRRTQVAPVARVRLPHRCEDVVDWTLNNGVLDITLRLVPVGELPSSDDEHPDELDDDHPPTFEDGTIAIDLSDDEDDEDDDGGIPIL
jgi:HSP20 family molecular chaperone IbpA